MHHFIEQLRLFPLGVRGHNAGGCSASGWIEGSGSELISLTPIDNSPIGGVRLLTRAEYDRIVDESIETFKTWRMVPAPQRGEFIRRVGNKLREHKKLLGRLITLEMGKILAEGEGEVQEMIDIADFAVGLSRQLCGSTMHSERPHHRMYEQWHPLGAVGVISAFNFPMAVWSWNAFIAAVCGDVVLWKPSEKTPLCAVAVQRLVHEVAVEMGYAGVFNLVCGERELGEWMATDRRLPLISATGSCAMGRKVAQNVAARLGRSLLELGGNNALIVAEDADLDMATHALLFGSVGTAGQRCTSTRRLIAHASIVDQLVERLKLAYAQVRVGNPLEAKTLMGPLIDEQAVEHMQQALQRITAEGGKILFGGEKLSGKEFPGGCYVQPTLVRSQLGMSMLQEEVFAPILHVLSYERIEDAIAMQNDVAQGLSSSIFTSSMITAETFLSAAGSDCGIANVNIGTSGAEIGGAFGGEKDTGGGREAGSDSWKAYMRRQTNTINWGRDLPLAQGIEFKVE